MKQVNNKKRDTLSVDEGNATFVDTKSNGKRGAISRTIIERDP